MAKTEEYLARRPTAAPVWLARSVPVERLEAISNDLMAKAVELDTDLDRSNKSREKSG
jgi:hypothetical protein